MPRTSNPPKESVPPTISPQEAIPLLRRQTQRLEEVMKLNFGDPAVDAWESTTMNLLTAVWGMPNGALHPNTSAIEDLSRKMFWATGNDSIDQPRFHEKQQRIRALLESFIEQLQDLAPPALAAAAVGDQYRFHADIERLSGGLYRDGHYKQAAFEAYIRVIEEVKIRSGLNDDGDSLMNRAFGCDKQMPVIQFNSLRTEAERDEQKGLLFLFKGIVGLRNFKAHSNRLFNDPYRAHEYLATASLLMRLLEIATVKRASE